MYFYGLRPGEETTIQIEEGNDTLIKFVGKSEPDEKGYRILQFEVNGFLREVKILDKHFEVKADRRLKTDPKNPGHLGATLPGTICDIRIKEGDRVTKNMPLMVIEAMKMETTVISKGDGRTARRSPSGTARNGLYNLRKGRIQNGRCDRRRKQMKFGGVDGTRTYYSAGSICISRQK